MIKIIVDSGSSIKQEEKEKYNVDILPLKISFNDKEYYDGIDLDIDEFYHHLLNLNEFPKTSLPNIKDSIDKVDEYTKLGYEIIIITISSKISGTYNMLKTTFLDYDNVHVIDSLSCVSGVKLLVDYINKNINLEINTLINNVLELRNRIKILAVPHNLDYLLKGGRLSKKEWLLGTLVSLKPIITMKDGVVCVEAKKAGMNRAQLYIINNLNIDYNHNIYGAYTYDKANLNLLLSKSNIKISEYDNLAVSIASHWGPYAYGLIYIENK